MRAGDHRHQAVVLGVVLASLAGSAGCQKWKEAQRRAAEKRASQQAETKVAIERLGDRLAAVRAKVRATSAASLREERCPDGDLLASVDAKQTNGRLRLVTVTTRALDDLVDEGATRHDAADELSFLTSTIVTGLKLGKAKGGYDDNEYRVGEMRKESGRYLGVYSVVEDTRPEVLEKRGVITGENVFAPGRFEAWLVVYDLEAAAPVCQMHVQAESSEDVKWKERGLARKTFEDALVADYVKQVKIAAKKAAARQSSKLELGYSTLL